MSNVNKGTIMKQRFIALLLAAALAAPTLPAAAHGSGASELSALSMLPVAVSVAAPVGLLSAGALFSVVAVEAASNGTLWVLERASDGARASVVVSGAMAAGASMVVGAAITCTAMSAGWVLSSAGRAIAFIPNEIGRALLHNERISR